MKKLLFIDRDGTLIKEAPPTYQVDSLNKLEFYPGVFTWLGRISRETDFELVMVTNQDGLGTSSFPETDFLPIQDFIIKTLKNEGICFSDIHIDRSFPAENAQTRKPGIAMLTAYVDGPAYDLGGSFVIGDRITDVQLARNLGCRAIYLNNDPELGMKEITDDLKSLSSVIALETVTWEKIYEFLKLGDRHIIHERITDETQISIELKLDGTGKYSIHTGLNFFDHMLDQLAKHSGIDLSIRVSGDLHIDEHHTVEDTGIALGEAFNRALSNKAGIGRYGFLLPMDDCLSRVAIDLGGRPWLVWETEFKRETIGDMPTEMFYHFFKSFCDAARCNLHIKAEGQNEHHKIESIFKGVARALRMALKRDPNNLQVPTTKAVL